MEKRDIVVARRQLAGELTKKFLPLEDVATSAAVQAAEFVAAMVAGHRDAALPPSAAAEAIELMSESSRLALQLRANVAKAHGILRDLPAELGLAFTEPECPPDFMGMKPLRIAA